MKIYVLTTGNKERVSHLEGLLNGIDFEFVYSLSQDELKEIERKKAKDSLKFRKKALMLGEFGAFITHSFAWEEIRKSNEPGIIIEDSADFVRDASVLLSKDVYDQILGCNLISFSKYVNRTISDEKERISNPVDEPIIFNDLKLNKAFPIRCYGMTPKAANVLLDNMNKIGMVQPVDKWISIERLSGISGYLSNIAIATRRAGLKSIANVRRGKSSLNPINLICRRINKIKYKY